ncbi:MAG TPA: hypothetical protein VF787_19610 [Thermoanaerobaculia bacterium]
MAQLPSPFRFTVVDGAQLGWGIDLLTGQLKLQTVSNITTVAATLNNATFIERMISTQSDYTSLIDTVTSVQGSTLTSSFSAGVSYMKSTSVSATTFSLIIGTTVQTTSEAFADASVLELSADAEAYLIAHGPAEFMAQYGTHFIGGFIEGGDFLGSLTIRTQSATTQQQVSASMHAALSDGFAGGSFNSSFQTAYTQYASESTLEVMQQSSGGEITPGSDADAMVAEAKLLAHNLTNGTGTSRRMIALGYTWDTIPKVNTILATNFPGQSMQIQIDPQVQALLADELNALDYQEQTAISLLGGAFVIPHQRDLLNGALSRISTARAAIGNLTIAQFASMDIPAAEQYLVSSSIAAVLTPIAQGKVAVNWVGNLDGTFQSVPAPLSGTVLLSVHGDSFTSGPYVHSRPEGDSPAQMASLMISLANTNGAVTLQAQFNWSDPYGPGSGNWYGETINLADDPSSTAASVAVWPQYSWNNITAKLA